MGEVCECEEGTKDGVVTGRELPSNENNPRPDAHLLKPANGHFRLSIGNVMPNQAFASSVSHSARLADAPFHGSCT